MDAELAQVKTTEKIETGHESGSWQHGQRAVLLSVQRTMPSDGALSRKPE